MRIALAQVASTTDPAANLDLIRDHARRAADGGAVVVVFPEATMCSFARPSREVAEPFDGPWATAVRGIASELGISIAVGMFTTSSDGRVHNTVLVTGHAEGRYDKIHLFDALGNTESRHIAPGREPVIVRAGHYGVGLTVCYDVRFPGLYTALGRSGAHAILVAASWAPGPHKVHQWRSAAIARAMDSTCFIIAIGQAAVGDVDVPGPPTGVGHSMVVDPTGTVLLELGEAPELAFVDIDADDVDRVREQLPVLRNARY
ncbi:MAG: carbon-nitrogen hydrolase family protein [Propionibacteriaceae bacterium]|nr:carbon-nitrogen hydrolase family protein [Propionibacteriaceae bacterium]HOA26949.1 carbon-nitrogen hydrolase family protein [Arachnia sp.]